MKIDKDRKHRMTRQREVILEQVKAGMHPTADEIYEKVRRLMPHVSMGTVYRNLDTLVSLGFIRKLGPVYPQMRFDGNTGEHYHLTCVHCGALEDTFFEETEDCFQNLENALGNLTKHGIFAHRLEFIGVCSSCRARGLILPVDNDNDTKTALPEEVQNNEEH